MKKLYKPLPFSHQINLYLLLRLITFLYLLCFYFIFESLLFHSSDSTHKEKPLKTRVLGLPKGYKYKEWLNSELNIEEPFIDYFKFADTFNGLQSATNYHYTDLLRKLSTGQTNKLTKIASTAKKLYDSRNKLDSEFGKRYEEYWEKKNEDINLQRVMRDQNQQAVLRLNEITNNQIQHLAQMANNNETSDRVTAISESDETEEELEEDSITERVIKQTANLPSTEVGGDFCCSI
ncbi:hypothetical protein EDC94DRAFT_348058 [Helicostylum pulchrum]|nr:hypothetical protein EDC94DRAFT_348058 [Helicostylum pulchrum]